MKSFSAAAALAFFSLLLFGGGIFLHTAPPALPAPAQPAKAASAPHPGKKKPASKAAAPKPAAPSIVAENTLALPLIIAGGIGLLLSALAGGILSYTAVPAARRLLDAAVTERRKQQEEFEAHSAALQTQLQEAKARKAETEAQREQVSRQFQEFFRTLPVPCFCFAASGKIIRWNAACETLYGIAAAAALDSTLWDTIIPASQREGTEAKIRRVLAGEALHGTERLDMIAGGEPAHLRCSMVPLYDAEGHIIGGLSAGVEVPETALHERFAALSASIPAPPLAAAETHALLEKAALREQIEQIEPGELSSKMLEKIVATAAQASAGSQAPQAEPSGHPAFRARLAEEVARAARYHGPLSLVVLDLDGFTARNRQFGVEAGDLALQSAAAALRSKLRTVDVMVHLGEGEYAIILPETGEAGARVAAERMQTGLAGGRTAGQPPQTACFGVVQLTPDVPDASELICRAQSALAAAQRCGVNSVRHYQDLPQAAHQSIHA